MLNKYNMTIGNHAYKFIDFGFSGLRFASFSITTHFGL